MTEYYFWCLVVLVCVPLVQVLVVPSRIYQFPNFMAAVFGMFILPQAVSLHHNPGAAPEGAVERVFLMSCLCLTSCLVGYSWPKTRNYHGRTNEINEQKLFHVGLMFVAAGLCFSWILAHTDIRTSESGGWTGPATIYGFFHQLGYPGFAICLTLTLRRRTLAYIASTSLGAIVPLQSIVFGRREPAVLFALTLGLTLYFQLRVRPARWLVASLMLAGMLLIPATGAYRQVQQQKDWEGLRQIDLAGNFRDYVEQESVLELRNGAMLIEATRRSGDYECGAGYWNHLVFRFIPAQILGVSFKESLMIHRSGDGVARALAGLDYINPAGSTVTGMGDSFQQFGFAGASVFAVFAWLFRRMWSAANRPGALFDQLLYIQTCTCAMRAVTHWTLDFLPGLAYNAVFLGAAFLYASGSGRKGSGAKHRHALNPPADPRWSRRGLKPACPALLAQCLGDNKNKHSAPQPSSQEQI